MLDAYIYDTVRTPRGKGKKDGTLHEVTALGLSSRILNELAKRNNLSGHAVEDVIWGNVTQIGEQGACLARSAVLGSDLDESIPGVSINRFCASGLEAVNMAANQVRGGAGDGFIAGGVESMSRVPMGTDGGAIAIDPELTMKNYVVPQGISADIIATKFGLYPCCLNFRLPQKLGSYLLHPQPFGCKRNQWLTTPYAVDRSQ